MLARQRERQLTYVALVYRMRQLACPLAALPVASVLHQLQATDWLWALMLFNALLWPHLAYAMASRANSPRHAESVNFLFETLLVGVWVAVMRYNLLPSAMLVAMLSMNHVSAGGWSQLARSLLLMVLACLGVSWLIQAPPLVTSDMTNVIACLPLLVINPVWLSRVNYSLGQRVRQQNRLLDQLNRTDPLTGLPNRTHWLDAAGKALNHYRRYQQPAALLLIDLDHFKQINDTHGHGAGDEMLRQMATVVNQVLRDVDTAGRLGGDEFGVVLARSDGLQALAVAERIRHQIEQLHFVDGGRRFVTTVSLGVAEITPGTEDITEWTRHADMALYQAKSKGRNRICEYQPVSSHAATAPRMPAIDQANS